MATSYSAVGSGSDRFRRKRHGQGTTSRRPFQEKEEHLKSSKVNVDVNSAILEAFKNYQVELDSRNDCYERIVKLSRDITIESKRVIFLLHRVTGSEDRNIFLKDAAARMLELRTTKFLALAKELEGRDPFQFQRAFSPGLQEYIEAVTFYHYLASNQLVSLDSIKAELTFILQNNADNKPAADNTSPKELTDICVDNNETSIPVRNPDCENEQDAGIGCAEPQSETGDCSADLLTVIPTSEDCVNIRTVSVPIPPTEYMMGVADFTGELMKMAINSVGCGDLESPKIVAGMMRDMHDAFASFGNIPRELRQKIRVLRQSLQKVETACYAMKVRGSERPAHVLVDVFTSSSGAGEMFSMDESEEFCD